MLVCRGWVGVDVVLVVVGIGQGGVGRELRDGVDVEVGEHVLLLPVLQVLFDESSTLPVQLDAAVVVPEVEGHPVSAESEQGVDENVLVGLAAKRGEVI